ncbi:MAG: 5'/3'-nucleotidase SurE [Synergistaceae bacterium]|jgi:5'-nucleotidase|nr:5'/3'-nucleotidase SurE [Synergistaceae bacterium]
MNLLLSNDDGVHAPGIIALANRLAELGHTVTVVAPDRERSGVGHALTTTSLHLKSGPFPSYDDRVKTFKCNGTPADCVMLGVEIVVPEAELVLSGINDGPNMGNDVFYSGTVAAAREGHFENRWALAASLVSKRNETLHYKTAVYAVETLLANLNILFEGEKHPSLLNVNIPNVPLVELRGFKMASAGCRRYRDRIQTAETPWGRTYWIQGIPYGEEPENSDVRVVAEGFVALTYLHYDTTDYSLNARIDENALKKIHEKNLQRE